MVTRQSAWLAGGGTRFAANPVHVTAAAPVSTSGTFSLAQPTSPTYITNTTIITPPTVAGMEPQAYEAILYGKDMPLFVGGKMLIGGRICEGPFFGGTQTDPTVSFIAYHAHNIVPELFTDSHVTSARLRGQEVWNSTSGYIATDKVPPGSFAWNPGHLQNVAFPQSVGRFGSSAVPYTGGITSSWENIPLKPFGGIVPFPSVVIENLSYGDPDDGITRTQAITNILQHTGLLSVEYSVNVSGSDPAWLVVTPMTLQEFLQQLRTIFVNYQIKYTDKLYITEPTTFNVAADLTNSNVLRDSLMFKRTDPLILSREKRYTYIDVDRDYEPNVAVAKVDRSPVPMTDSVNSTNVELPIVTTAAQAVADVHVSLYEEMSMRNIMEGTADVTLFGTECGDAIRYADSDVINFVGRVMETKHDFENWTVQFQSAEVLNCGGEAEADFVECYNNEATTTTTTFASADLGGIDANRHIIVAIEMRLVAAGQTITGVTIGGVAAIEDVVASNTAQGLIAAVWHAAVPLGATGDVVVTTSGNHEQVSIHVYRIVSASLALYDTNTEQATTSSAVEIGVGVTAGAVIIASGATREGAWFTWTGAVESCTFVNDVETTGQRSSAMYRATALDAARAITIDPSSADRVVLAAASFTT